MIENLKKFGILEGYDPKITWNSKGIGHKKLDLLNRGCTVFFWKSPLFVFICTCLYLRVLFIKSQMIIFNYLGVISFMSDGIQRESPIGKPISVCENKLSL